nr:unnamed protein product [Digitaria exilis]
MATPEPDPPPRPGKPPLPWRARLLVGAASTLHAASLRRDGTVNRFLLSLFDRAAPPTPSPVAGHRLPAPYDDGEAALRWVLAGAGGVLPCRHRPAAVFVAGDSAGGNVAHHVAARLPGDVAGLVALQPFFGGEAATESELRLRDAPFGAPERLAWLWRAFLPPGATRDHDAANVPDAIRRDADAGGGGEGRRWRAFPATLVCVGGWDVHQDRQRAYADALRAAGAEEVAVVEYPDAIHGFYILGELEESRKLVNDVAEFVNRRAEQLKKRELDHAEY